MGVSNRTDEISIEKKSTISEIPIIIKTATCTYIVHFSKWQSDFPHKVINYSCQLKGHASLTVEQIFIDMTSGFISLV